MSNFDGIERAFADIKKSQSATNVNKLSEELTKEFKKTITCRIINDQHPLSRFVMSTTPDATTLDHVLEYAANTSTKVETLISIWKGSNRWEIEINKQALKVLNSKELTAVVCHEVWHVLYSDRCVRRLQDSLSFVIQSSKNSVKNILGTSRFKKILRIPGLVSCQMLFNKDEIVADAAQHKKYLEKEMLADSFAATKGYRLHLINAISKLESEMKREGSNQTELATVYSAGILEDLTKRREALAKNKLLRMRDIVSSEILSEAAEEIYDDWFVGRDETFLESYIESVDTQVFEELGLFSKHLTPIEQNQIDYAYVKAEDIQTTNDKMMILSYVNSKIELVEYYMAILDDAKLVKKYKVPHTKSELDRMKNKLEAVREKILNTPVVRNHKNIIVYYPDGYEG